ncbi:AI-2E family transporter [Tellurirhabdus rosea]|uniref:AI-2E family transporter n=1 Tax=Tellurirhabdus rosea TaxID=2674997 RepID=UPI0022562476|nr:AI-2E family transporter [Tellurirhabdus rosea]
MNPQPFYHRLSHSLLALGIITVAIYLGQDILVPLAHSVLLAVLLRPLEKRLLKLGMHKVVAISLALFLAVLVVAGIGTLLSVQIANFMDDWPKLERNIDDVYRTVRRWVRREYKVSYRQQEQYIEQVKDQTTDSLNGVNTLGLITGPLGTITLIPIYIFLLMYYRTMLLHFCQLLFPEQFTGRVREILGEIKAVIQSYVVGLLLETASVAALNIVGLVVLGVQYAVLLGIMAAILNLIPYIGGLVATVLAVALTMVNHPQIEVLLGVVAVFLFVQFIDNNILVPLIVASKVRINALVSIVGVLIGGVLAGVSGMFLSIPVIAILKVIFDRVEGLEAWGVLLGDETPETKGDGLFKIRRRVQIYTGDEVDT